MAKQLKDFAFRSTARITNKYDWDSWLNGKIWELERGVDFEIDPSGMRTACYLMAKRRGLNLTVHMSDKKLVLQAMTDTAERSARKT